MNSKEIILNRIAGAAMPPVDYPAFDFTPLRFEDRTAAFAEAVKAAGGQVVAADGNPLTELIRRYYPDAKTIASVLPEAHATINPDTVDDARKLIDIDLGVIDGCFGVAENGAVWIRQDIRHKALYFGATALMILIPRDALVGRMGGDEFAVFSTCPLSVEEAQCKACELIEAWGSHSASRAVELGCSVGIVRVVRGETFFDLYRAADCALYASKDNGKGCYSW